MVENFLEVLVIELNTACMNKESVTHIAWTVNDVNLDINKCRKNCDIDSGYMWNGVKICDSCDKILHKHLDRFNKSILELAFENYNLETSINNLSTKITDITKQLDIITNNFNSQINIVTTENNNLKNIINKIEHDITNINIHNNNMKNNIQNNIKNNNILIENLLQSYEIKYQNIANAEHKTIEELSNKFNQFTNSINNTIINEINKKINNNNININYNKINEDISDIKINNKNIDNKNIDNKNIDNKNIDNKNIDNKNIDNKNIDNLKINYYNPSNLSYYIDNEKKYNIINKQIDYQNNINNKNNKIANLKIFDKFKIGGCGYVLSVNTTSNGNVKRDYTYQSMNGDVIFKIKDFENNFCPTEFNYPDTGILIVPKFIKGNITLLNIYDEFYCINTY